MIERPWRRILIMASMAPSANKAERLFLSKKSRDFAPGFFCFDTLRVYLAFIQRMKKVFSPTFFSALWRSFATVAFSSSLSS
jgi:hypothetical protein